jgi:plasmid segregation protein ParM
MTANNARRVAVAIDIGFGAIKIAYADPDGKRCELTYPSLTIPVSDQQAQRSALTNGNTRIVNVDQSLFLGGLDVYKQSTDPRVLRSLAENFWRTPSYRASLLIALSYVPEDAIDMLAIGLPIDQFKQEKLREDVKNLATGLHVVPDGRTVFVRSTLVLPQGFGAFVAHAKEAGETFKNSQVLILDIGFFTSNLLPTKNGAVVVSLARSVPNAGVEQILQHLVEALRKDYPNLSANDSFLIRLEEAVRSESQSIFLAKTSVELHPYLEAALHEFFTRIDRAISRYLGPIDEYRTILIVGGGAHIAHRYLVAQYPNQDVITPDSPEMMNARGYLLAATRELQKSIPAEASTELQPHET